MISFPLSRIALNLKQWPEQLGALTRDYVMIAGRHVVHDLEGTLDQAGVARALMPEGTEGASMSVDVVR